MASTERGRWKLTAETFASILFLRPADAAELETRRAPDFFGDLNLDQVLEALTAGREEYALEPFFAAPLHEVAAVHYRHEALRELERPEVREAVKRFAAGMRRMREHLAQSEKLRHPLQGQARFLDAVAVYCHALRALAEELGRLELSASGFRGLRDHLAATTGGEAFAALAEETDALQAALAGIRYAVSIHGARVTVSRFAGEPDYGAEVEQTFARFEQGAVGSYLAKLPRTPELDHVEAQILERVARLYPDEFGRLADYCGRRRDYLDATLARFDREVQFYLAYLELVGRLRAAGLPFCYPHVSARSRSTRVERTFDLALAAKLVAEGGTVVTNDFHLDEPERVFVVTGPNNGGKTTFARTFGQLHHLAGLGLLVPGAEARLFLPDRIFTHFEREEEIETLRGRFEEELVRVHEILEQATDASVVVMNESFGSTTLNDALAVGSEVMRQLLDRGCLGLYVTFVDELASLGEAVVSMVGEVVPGNPAERTFKLVRRPADGLAYAWAIAEKYGLSYDRLVEAIDG